MVGIIVIVLVLVVVIPVGVMMSAGLATFILGSALTRRAEDAHADSELVETNY
jgi:hypothetical protein